MAEAHGGIKRHVSHGVDADAFPFAEHGAERGGAGAAAVACATKLDEGRDEGRCVQVKRRGGEDWHLQR